MHRGGDPLLGRVGTRTQHENAQADTDAADVADAGTNAHVQADAETSDAADAVHGIYLF